MKIGKYTVSNTNGNKTQRDTVRVIDESGTEIAKVHPTSRNPLAYIRRHPSSKYAIALRDQLAAAKVDHATMLIIFEC